MAIHIGRREFIVALGGAFATCPLVAQAQQTVRVLRVGFVGGQPRDAAIYVAFRKRMAELGYRDRYFTFEYIQTPSIDAYDASFRELVARKPDIVMAAGNEPALRAARAAAGMLPIVFLAVDFDPVERGYVASLARPGGNITGIFVHPLELAAKRIELLRESLPQARHLGLIWDASSRDQVEAAAVAAKSLNFEPRRIEVTGQPPDYAAAFGQILRGIARALTARGIPTARGGTWTPVQISGILHTGRGEFRGPSVDLTSHSSRRFSTPNQTRVWR
jgi:putative tryptophan/tyrosine transport system substrate-binding protein